VPERRLGKLISALWDPWEKLSDFRAELASSDIYILRHIVPEDRGKKFQPFSAMTAFSCDLRLRPSFETPDAFSFAKASEDTSAGDVIAGTRQVPKDPQDSGKL
jgi:hypothetical protein